MSEHSMVRVTCWAGHTEERTLTNYRDHPRCTHETVWHCLEADPVSGQVVDHLTVRLCLEMVLDLEYLGLRDV